jgi:hypothetical protein
MTKNERRGSRALRELLGEFAGEVIFAAVIALLVLVLSSLGLPSVDVPDLPDVNPPDWVGTAFKYGKFVALGALAIAFVVGALDRRQRSG